MASAEPGAAARRSLWVSSTSRRPLIRRGRRTSSSSPPASASPGATPRAPRGSADGRAVAERADAGDVDAAAIVSSAARAVAAALRSCIAILDPDVVVLGGGIGAADGVVAATCRTELYDLLTRANPPAVVSARLGSGRIGWRRISRLATAYRRTLVPHPVVSLSGPSRHGSAACPDRSGCRRNSCLADPRRRCTQEALHRRVRFTFIKQLRLQATHRLDRGPRRAVRVAGAHQCVCHRLRSGDAGVRG